MTHADSPTDPTQLQQEIETAAAKFGVLDYAPAGFCLLRPDLVVVFWNQCLENWTKISHSDIVGSRLSQWFPNINQPKYTLRLQQVFEAGFPAIFSPQLHHSLIPMPLPNGQLRVQQTTVTAVPALMGTGFYALVAIQDVTELTQRIQIYQTALKELKQAEAELQRSNAELEQFAYVASHDLREPLRMVITFTHMLRQRYSGRFDDQADQMLHFAADGASRMQGLINDLLTYSRVGRRGNAFQWVDCSEVLKTVLNNLQANIDESGISITTHSLPTVWADSSQLVQLFQNLINNAVKYRGEETPEVQIGAERQENEWLFWVRDNGIGFDRKHAERIFLIFQRLHTREAYPGTGIGLAICKKIVERHGGRIWVDSMPEKGSTFYFTLPNHQAEVPFPKNSQ